VEDEDDNRNANAQLIAELKEQVQKAEQASDNYRKQLEVLQKRLDDFAEDQIAVEEREQKRQTELDTLLIDLKDSVRQRRELEQSHEVEKNLMLRERDRHAGREAELQIVISRLNERLRAKELRHTSVHRICTMKFQVRSQMLIKI
jgi:uncharacterized coiled-coil protein SlyX